MIRSVTIVLALSVIGDALAQALEAPVPGAAIGLLLLAGVFAARGGPDASCARLFDLATPYFPLFFVPAAVGVVTSAEVLAHSWVHFATAIVLGTAVTIGVTGALAQVLLRALGKVRPA